MAEVNDLITDNIDIWTSAVKRKSSAGRGSGKKVELYGVKKLRELILDLAVRGLLVPQDPSDEPASVLLEKIAVEKSKKESSIGKKTKKLPNISADESLNNQPTGWGKTRLGEIIRVINGRAYKKHEMLQEGTPLLRVGNLFTSKEWYYSDLELEPDKYIDNGDLIYAWSASFGPFIWEGGKTIYHYHIWKMDFYSPRDCDKYYFELYLRAISTAIKASGSGIAMIHMTKDKMEKLALPIPPLQEQHRIVAKVDELMALCDQLEQQTEASLTAHQTLVKTLLDALTQAATQKTENENTTANTPSPFEQAWQRLAEHFDTVFTTEGSIDQLKQTILQLAVMGKLVPQDPNDEPASELLKRIAAEKAELVKAKKIKKQKVLPEISDDEKPFELPVGWEFCRLIDCGYEIGGGTPSKSKPEYWNGNIPWVCPKDMKVDYLTDTHDLITKKAIEETTVKRIPTESLLMVVRGMILAHSFPVAISSKSVSINQDMKALVFSQLEPGFMLINMKSVRSKVVGIVDRSSHGTCKLTSEKLWALITPIPPLPEQQRIVAKVNELSNICDQLKARLNQTQTTQLQLTDTVTKQAISQ